MFLRNAKTIFIKYFNQPSLLFNPKTLQQFSGRLAMNRPGLQTTPTWQQVPQTASRARDLLPAEVTQSKRKFRLHDNNAKLHLQSLLMQRKKSQNIFL